jgi:hypothetical protein
MHETNDNQRLLAAAICAFDGFAFRISEQWGSGRERPTWPSGPKRERGIFEKFGIVQGGSTFWFHLPA